ncbi:helix-turn-helix domain-containing protein [Leptobacterium flavescens]|uniref:Helix-turn-helix domain-containing protein n=1 Tax=Leptobacterium flavescens TaxID=472055 RepID=A0A6P0UMR7_9FLAO|nr:helix-turn-helix domain-containing protein [Leptobacterium flavescens]NER13139.1 helix-turn-helix domain-containing protein [Leptobacterium flavescens]
MSLHQIKTYCFDPKNENSFQLSVIDFDHACVVSKSRLIDTFNIFWIRRGKGSYNIDFKSYSFDEEVILFLTPGQVFSVESEFIQEAYWLSFEPDFYCIETHDKEISCNGILFNNVYESPYVNPSAGDSEKLCFILENMVEEFEKKEDTSGHLDMLQTLLKQFIIFSVRVKNLNQPFADSSEETLLYKNFSLLLEKNYNKIHSVSEYAGRLGVSPKSLTKHLHRIGAASPSELIRDRILLEAKRLLLYSEFTVKEIALSLGFNDPAYFTRFFTKGVQKSPVQFKSEHQK